jgi:hypothetical protein
VRRVIPVASLLTLAACGGGSAPSSPSAPVPASTPAVSPSPAAVVVRAAVIRGANGHAAAGLAEIVRSADAYALELRSDFRVDIGSVDVYLTRGGAGIADGDLNLGSLRSLTGAQSYPMPSDGSVYTYVLLWCRPFRVPIGVGELR